MSISKLKRLSELALLKRKEENPLFHVIREREEKLFIFKEEEDIFYSFEGYRDIIVKGRLELLKDLEIEEEGLYFNLSDLKKFLRLKNKNEKLEFMIEKPYSWSTFQVHK